MSVGPARALPWWGWSGGAILALGAAALAVDAPVWNVLWYVPAWYGWLLLVDGWIWRRRGRSFLSHREGRRETLALALLSVPFWYLFELYNLRLRNWHYVFVLRTPAAQAAMGVAAFATVLPACFFHAELVRAIPALRGEVRTRPWQVDAGARRGLVALGILCVVAPWLWPRFTFPLVWGATLILPDLANRARGAPSLLADLESGRAGRALRLLAGGGLAGLVWEALNYGARCKWIYTVPGLEELKLFEMPMAGFLGFPVLALGAFACDAWVGDRLRGGRHWEAALDPPAATASGAAPPQPSALRGRRATALLLGIAVSTAGFALGSRANVASVRPLLFELAGLDEAAAGRLAAAGVPSPERLQRLDSAARRALARRSGIAAERLDQAARHATLALHKGMGAHRAAQLQALGIDRPAALRTVSAEQLHALLVGAFADPPRLAEVRVWRRAAPDGDGYRR